MTDARKRSGKHATPRWKLALPLEARELMRMAADAAGEELATYARVAIAEACARDLGISPIDTVAAFEADA